MTTNHPEPHCLETGSAQPGDEQFSGSQSFRSSESQDETRADIGANRGTIWPVPYVCPLGSALPKRIKDWTRGRDDRFSPAEGDAQGCAGRAGDNRPSNPSDTGTAPGIADGSGGVAPGHSDDGLRSEAIRPPRLIDPFFLALDAALAAERAALAAERLIRVRAKEMLHILKHEPWQVGGPEAQAVEMRSAHRIIRESLAREHAERS